MVVPIAASMAVKGVFKAGGLLSGLSTTAAKLKEAGMRSKSTTTEMKRMAGHAKKLGMALTGISVAGFTALMLSAPQLAGSLAKIKTELTLMAYAVGAKLKPALDAVGTILRGIRTGDWTVVKQGVKDLTTALFELMAIPGTFIIDLIFGEGTAEKTREDLFRWLDGLKTEWEAGDLPGFLWKLIADPAIWLMDRLAEAKKKIMAWASGIVIRFVTDISTKGLSTTLRNLPVIGKMMQFGGYDRAVEQKVENMQKYGTAAEPWAGGGMSTYGPTMNIPANERLSPNINIDFKGANITTTSEEDVKVLAERVAMAIATSQQALMI